MHFPHISYLVEIVVVFNVINLFSSVLKVGPWMVVKGPFFLDTEVFYWMDRHSNDSEWLAIIAD